VQNLPIDGSFHRASLSHLLDRTRDVDKKTRKLVFARLHSNIRSGDGFGPTHPRKLTIAQRELIITNGLGDREPEVRAVAAGLITAWVDAIIEDDTIKKEEDSEDEEEEGEDKDKSQDKTQKNKPSAQDGLVELLKMLDLGEGTVASDALLSVFTTDTAKTKFVENMDFKSTMFSFCVCSTTNVIQGNFWQTLTAEKAFLVRIFTEFCRGQKNDLALVAILEETLPAIKHFVLVIRAFFSQFKDEISATEEEYVFNEMDDEERERRADAKYNLECIIGELLKIAVNLDYVDEFGRRDMYKLIRKFSSIVSG